MKRLILWLPLVLFLAFVVTVTASLHRPGEQRPVSQLVGKPLPQFDLPPATEGKPGVETADFQRGKPRLINLFASWCIPCIAEAPQLMALSRAGVPIDAVAVRDKPEDVAAFLARWGDPYRRIGADKASRIQLALGASGVPESYVVDGRGIIRYHHVGEIRPEHIAAIREAFEAAQ